MTAVMDLALVMNVPTLCEDLPAGKNKNGRQLNLKVLHDAMRRALDPLNTESRSISLL